MKRIVLLLLLGLVSVASSSVAQDIVRIVVLSEQDKQPISDVICRAYGDKQKVKAYRLSNGRGEVQFPKEGIYTLVCTKLGYQTCSVDIGSGTDRLTIYLKEQVTQLREVVVKSSAIRQDSDTIRYNATRFIGASDRYLEDIIAKMPGLSIDERGYIQYQGRYIKRLYVEGQDLLGAGYNIAAQALPAEGISEVQVLENHQHISRLKGKVYEDKASINVKLKKSHKYRLIGDLGAGLSRLGPLVGFAEAKLSHFGEKYQGLYVLQANNKGHSYAHSAIPTLDLEHAEVYDLAADALGGDRYRSLSEVELGRYLDNRSLLASTRGLLSLDSVRTLKYSAQGLWEHRQQTSSERQLFGGAISTLWEKQRAYRSDDNSLALRMSYEQNSTRSYLTNTLSADYHSGRSTTEVSANGQSYHQRAGQDSYSIENVLSTSFALGGRDIIYKGLVRGYSLPERISILAGDNEALGFRQRGFTLNNHLSTLWSLSRGTFSLGFIERYKSQHYMAGTAASRSSHIDLSIGPSYTHRYTAGLWSIALSPRVERIALASEQEGAKASRTLYSVSTNVHWKQDVTTKLQLSMGLNHSSRLVSEPYPLLGGLRTSYWNYLVPPRDIHRTSIWGGSLGLNYKNIYRALFGRIHLSYSLRAQDYILSHRYDATSYTQAYETYDNTSRQWSVIAGLDKSWLDAGLTFKYDLAYKGRRYSLMQNEAISEATSSSLVHSLRCVLRTGDFLSARAEVEYSSWWLSNNRYQVVSTGLSLVKARLSLDATPTKAWQCKLGAESYWNELGRGLWSRGVFLDFSIAYRLSKQLEFSFACTNLLGSTDYRVEYIHDLNTETFSMPLRGREVSLGVVYRL